MKPMKRTTHASSGLVVCVSNAGYPVSLEKRKIYRATSDKNLQEKHLLRIVDESGEDYLYPENHFLPIHLPKEEQKVITLMR
jgi:hypothetical protein